MRHIDIIRTAVGLAALFVGSLACAASVAAGESIWLKDPSTGLAVWDSDGGHKVVVSWSGNGIDGKADGSGVLSWFSDGKLLGRFEGTLVAGKAQGTGKLVFASENGFAIYEGEFKDHDLEGRGKLIADDGSTADGDWVAGALNGWVDFRGADGSKYQGEIKNNRPHGSGYQLRGNNEEYFGDFVEGLRHGKGELLLPNGDIYSGEFANDLPHGAGRLVSAEGGIFAGEFVEGVPQGEGTVTTPDGETAVITVVNGQAEGEVVFTAEDGTTRTETWKNGVEVTP